MHQTARQYYIRKLRLERELAIRESEASLSGFARHSWRIIEPGRPFEFGWHIDAIGEHLEAIVELYLRNLIINIPPRHMKSILTCVDFPAWTWGPKNRPELDWLFSSYSPKLTSRDSAKCRKIIESAWYRSAWKHNFLVDPERKRVYDRTQSLLLEDQNEKMNYRNVHSGSRVSTSQGGTGTGEGGDVIVYDDPHKVRGVESDVKRLAAIDYWTDEMSTRGNDPKTVRRVVIMQRVHEDDLSGRLLEEYGDMYEHLCLPFEYVPKIQSDLGSVKPMTSIGFIDPRKTEGERLWDRFDGKAGDDLKALIKPYQRSGQLQQQPSSPEGETFKRVFFEDRWKELPPRWDYLVTTWDLTFGTGPESKGAYDVGYVLGYFRGKFYVVDEVRERMEPFRQEEATQALKQKWGATTILIEDAANGRSTAKKIRRNVTGVLLVRVEGSKEDRARSVQDIFMAKDVLFPEDTHAPWVKEAIEEIVGFSEKAKFKDRVDALTQGVSHLEKKLARLKRIVGATPASLEKASIVSGLQMEF